MDANKKPYFYVSITALLWGSSAAMVKLLLDTMDNFQVLLYLSLFAVISLLFVVIKNNKLKYFKKYSKKDYGFMMILGLLGVYIYYIFLFLAFTLVPVNEAYIVNYMWPIFIIILASFFLKEKLSVIKLFAISLGFIGIYFTISQGQIGLSFSHLNGYVLSLIAAFSWAIFSVLIKKYKYETYTSLLIYYTASLIFVIITLPLFSSYIIPSLKDIPILIYLGVFTNTIGYVCWIKALKLGDTAKISNIIFITPFISLIFIYFIIGEVISIYSIIGLTLIISGVLIQNLRK